MCGLCRPQEGRILACGAPLEQLKKDTRMSIFSYVPQKAMVFQDSARENILAYHDGIDEEAVRRACDAAVFTEVAGELENGLDTVMAQGGMNLSGGQRKRLSLARGLAKDAAVYLLDDPFAALDAVTARAVRDNTLRLLEGKTIVMVAQRFSQLMDFDQIIMMDQGKIVAAGTHEELLAGCSEYADMFRIQCSLESETEAL
jgi:ATP-binding cassette subfamily B protein